MIRKWIIGVKKKEHFSKHPDFVTQTLNAHLSLMFCKVNKQIKSGRMCLG